MAETNGVSSVVREFRETDAWGLCTCIDLLGCDPAGIRDADRIRQYLVEVCDLIGMKRFGEPQVVHFGPTNRVAGYSMTQLIETSLISGHFANETNSAYIDIFSCKEYEPDLAADFTRRFFGAGSATVRTILRQ
ncbi:MAG: S-adenosylmethionine decarboxylase [Methanospirillum sp.]|nr:S-adenosylmethionine decarboxylase [Methanospirillum sp.]